MDRIVYFSKKRWGQSGPFQNKQKVTCIWPYVLVIWHLKTLLLVPTGKPDLRRLQHPVIKSK